MGKGDFMRMKRCPKCNQIKPITEFFNERTSQCKDCIRKYYREKYQKAKNQPIHPPRKYKKHKNMPPSNTLAYQKELRRRKMSLEKRQYIEQLEYLKDNNLRKCYKCKEIKPLEEFTKNRKRPQGYQCLCKECQHKYYKEWYKKNGRNRNKKAQKAEWEVNKAKKNGTLIVPEKCELCGKSGDIRAHHPNYNKPLEIIWVCRSCHRNLHRKMN